jgi:hypothetical protein
MPIHVAQLQAARLDLETRGYTSAILAFLKGHPDLAYNTDELRQEIVATHSSTEDTAAFYEALLWLSDLGLVDQRIVSGQDYYAFVADFSDLQKS